MKTEYFASKKPQSNERLLLVTRLHYLLSINACMCQRYSCYLEIPNKLFCIGYVMAVECRKQCMVVLIMYFFKA